MALLGSYVSDIFLSLSSFFLFTMISVFLFYSALFAQLLPLLSPLSFIYYPDVELGIPRDLVWGKVGCDSFLSSFLSLPHPTRSMNGTCVYAVYYVCICVVLYDVHNARLINVGASSFVRSLLSKIFDNIEWNAFRTHNS